MPERSQCFICQEIVDDGNLGRAVPPARRDIATGTVGIDCAASDPASFFEVEAADCTSANDKGRHTEVFFSSGCHAGSVNGESNEFGIQLFRDDSDLLISQSTH